jgi:hypothetical protein
VHDERTPEKESYVHESDRLQSAAESRLHTVNGGEPEDGLDDRDLTALDPEEVGLHLDDGGDDGHLDDDERDNVAEIDTDVVDAFAEAFNARDLDALLAVVAADGEAPGLLGGDRDGLAEAVEGLWHRRPTCCVTRGRVNEVVVGVLWEHDGTTWWPLATVHVADLDDDGMVGVLEFSDDASLLDEVEAERPDGDLEEGSRWSEWDEGSD